jgi:Cu/Ag efflux protein CusF
MRFRPIVGLTAVLVLCACNRSAPSSGVAESAGPGAQTAVEHMAVGTLNSVDATAGTVNITHAPVPSAGWPQMTMSFKLEDPKAADEIAPGQRVDFHFTIESGMNATVTYIEPIK